MMRKHLVALSLATAVALLSLPAVAHINGTSGGGGTGTGALSDLSNVTLPDARINLNLGSVSTLDYCPTVDGVTDNTTCLQTAFNTAKAAGKNIHWVHGNYLVTSSISVSSFPYAIIGDGAGTTKVTAVDSTALLINNSALTSLATVYIDHISFLAKQVAAPGAYSALLLTGTGAAAQEGQRQFIVGSDVNLSGFDQNNAWHYGVNLQGASYSDVHASVIGSINTYGLCVDAVRVNNSTDVRVNESRLYHCQNGVNVIGSSESVYVTNSTIVDVDYGCMFNTIGGNGGNDQKCNGNYIQANRGFVNATGTVGTVNWVLADDNVVSRQQFSGTCGCAVNPVDTGTAQAGGASTITFANTASSTDNFYNGRVVTITAGTGSVETSATISSYVGATRVATLSAPWSVTPNNTSVYRVETLFVGFRMEGLANNAIGNSVLTAPALSTDVGVDIVSTATYPVIVGNSLTGFGIPIRNTGNVAATIEANQPAGITNTLISKLVVNNEVAFTGVNSPLTNSNGLMLWGGTNGGTIYARGDVAGGDDDLTLQWIDTFHLNSVFTGEVMSITRPGAAKINFGLQIGAPTGGDKGTGNLNIAGTLYDNGTIATGTAGSGYVRATSPTLVTPALGVASATTINKVTLTPPASGSTLTIADGKTATHSSTTTFAGVDGKTLTVNNSLTLAGTDATTMTFPTTSKTLMATDYSNGTTLTANAILTGGGAAAAPNAVAITGLVKGNGASAPTAYGGTSCTNQFARSLDLNGAAICASVANADLAGSIAASKLVGTDLTTVGALTAGSAGAGFTLTDTINQEFEVSTATLTKTTDTALATVSGLSQALTAGKTYNCRGHLTGTAGASGGIKVALVATASLSATQATWTGFTWNGTTAVSNTTVTALGSNIAAATAVYSDVYIDGSIVVNAAGTINVQAAQNASNGTATTVLQGSTFSCVRVN